MSDKNEYLSNSPIDELVGLVSDEINGILRTNLYETGLGDMNADRLKRRKSDLRDALKNCGIGDTYAKNYVKQTIKNIVISKLITSTSEYDRYITFDNPNKLTVREKFDILLYFLSLKYGEKALGYIVDKCTLSNRDESIKAHKVSDYDIEKLYFDSKIYLSSGDKLEIIVQRIYSSYKGLGVIDEIRDMNIEGVSAGVSGKSGEQSTVWIFYKGINFHLSFLKFRDERELERVCMNIYRYGSPGQLSKSKGYIVNEMKDHSRVVVVRPPFAENFAFFVRKFNTIESKHISQLITDKGSEIVEDVLKYIIKGCQVCAITGAQGSGKTTLLMSLIDFISPSYTLRIQEQAFELHLRDIYPERNILTFRETEYVSGQEGLDIQKKTDGSVNILGEVASNDVAAWMIQMSQVGSLFTLFTHHAKTTENLIKYMRNALIINGNFNNESIALEQVVEAIRFDVHMEKDVNGHRYIERITEIIKKDDMQEVNDSDEKVLDREIARNANKNYEIRDVVVYTENGYVISNGFSDAIKKEISKRLSKEDVEKFYEYCNIQN